MKMKQVSRAVVAAAALASAGSVFAATSTVSLDAASMAANGVTASALGTASYNTSSGILTANLDSANTTASLIDYVNADGFKLAFKILGFSQTASFADFSYDVATKTIMGDLVGTGVIAGVLNYQNGGLLTAGTVTNTNGTLVASNFSVSPSLAAYLESNDISTAQLSSVTSVIKSVSMPSPVPEPSTYALMLLGLGGIAVAARRKAKA
jgi:PEP-CTERM motif